MNLAKITSFLSMSYIWMDSHGTQVHSIPELPLPGAPFIWAGTREEEREIPKGFIAFFSINTKKKV